MWTDTRFHITAISLDCQAIQITHATELVLDSPGFFRDFPPKQHLLDNWSGHVTELKYFKYFKIEFEYTTSMEVDGPDLDALESDDQLLRWSATQ